MIPPPLDEGHPEARSRDEDFQSLIANLSDVIAVVDRDHLILYTSPAAERVLGYAPENLVGRDSFAFAHPTDLPLIEQSFRDTLAGKKPDPTVTCRARHKDGSWKFVEVVSKRFQQESGRVVVILNARDITERKQAEDRLAAQLEISGALAAARSVAEAAPAIVRALVQHLGWQVGVFWLVDRRADVLRALDFWSMPGGRYDGFIGLSRATEFARGVGLPGRVWGTRSPGWVEDVAADPKFPRTVAATAAGLHAGVAFPVAIGDEVVGALELFADEVRRPDAELLEMMTTVGGQIGQFVDRQRAADERDLLVEQLEQTSAELSAVFRAMPDLVFRLDHDGRIVDYSAGRTSDLYAPPEAFLGKTMRDVLPKDAAEQLDIATSEAHRTGSVMSVEYELDMPESLMQYEARCVPFGRQTIALVRNITDRLRTEQALRVSEERLRESQKLEAIGRLAGGVAHDFNNLLMAVLAYSSSISKRFPPDHPLQRDVNEIRKAGERAASLTKQLLAFGRRQVMQARVVDLNEIVADMEAMLSRLIGEHIELTTALSEGVCLVQADPGQIEQVLVNLALNARDAMPEGGKLAIRTETVDLDEGDAQRHDCAGAGLYVALTVTDTGHGMDAETQSHVFEPFFTTKDHGRGTGLGLATVYGIVKQSGGFIRVESAQSRGTSFVVTLPCVEGPVDTPAPTDSAPLPRGDEAIFVVEDEEAVRALVVEVLTQCGYRVTGAPHAAGALEALRLHHGPLDLLVTDMVMPGSNGRELAGWIVTLHPECKVLYMSGYPEGAFGGGARLDPDHELLQKPFNAGALARRVRALLDQPPRNRS